MAARKAARSVTTTVPLCREHDVHAQVHRLRVVQENDDYLGLSGAFPAFAASLPAFGTFTTALQPRPDATNPFDSGLP